MWFSYSYLFHEGLYEGRPQKFRENMKIIFASNFILAVYEKIRK